uniref:Uncharacterized protein n=1 Tax=Coccidioides posadasii RMSCC 3488 TaxID=454284 RepID=A0A0J6FS76_COCPO|nr:hypothetical protein CPAG_08220 [Coccidioides posadasii RMSCC 3488]
MYKTIPIPRQSMNALLKWTQLRDYYAPFKARPGVVYPAGISTSDEAAKGLFPWTFQNLFRITDSGISAVRSRKREFKVLCRSAAEEYKSNLRRRQSKKFSLDTAVESLVGMDVDDPP